MLNITKYMFILIMLGMTGCATTAQLPKERTRTDCNQVTNVEALQAYYNRGRVYMDRKAAKMEQELNSYRGDRLFTKDQRYRDVIRRMHREINAVYDLRNELDPNALEYSWEGSEFETESDFIAQCKQLRIRSRKITKAYKKLKREADNFYAASSSMAEPSQPAPEQAKDAFRTLAEEAGCWEVVTNAVFESRREHVLGALSDRLRWLLVNVNGARKDAALVTREGEVEKAREHLGRINSQMAFYKGAIETVRTLQLDQPSGGPKDYQGLCIRLKELDRSAKELEFEILFLAKALEQAGRHRAVIDPNMRVPRKTLKDASKKKPIEKKVPSKKTKEQALRKRAESEGCGESISNAAFVARKMRALEGAKSRFKEIQESVQAAKETAKRVRGEKKEAATKAAVEFLDDQIAFHQRIVRTMQRVEYNDSYNDEPVAFQYLCVQVKELEDATKLVYDRVFTITLSIGLSVTMQGPKGEPRPRIELPAY